MEAARTILEEEVETRPKRSAEELLETVGGEKSEPREDIQVSLRNVATISPPTIFSTRSLTAEDMAILRADLPPVVFAGDISPGIIRSSHHAMARDLANDRSLVDVSRRYGLPIPTLRSLLDAPAFQELLLEYQGVDSLEFDMESKLEALAHDSLDEIRTRLEVSPDKFTTNQLMQVSSDMLDRAGYGKVTKHMQLNGGLGGTDLEKIKKREPQLSGRKAPQLTESNSAEN